jgi:hypothetical protein
VFHLREGKDDENLPSRRRERMYFLCNTEFTEMLPKKIERERRRAHWSLFFILLVVERKIMMRII